MRDRFFIYWRRLIALNAAVFVGYIFFKLYNDVADIEYIHLMVDYRFGFTKRALIGSLVSLIFDRVPLWLTYTLGIAVLLVTLGLYLRLFQKTFGFSRMTAPLFCFIAGSPFFFKNFVTTAGYFDIYGCTLAIILLLVPARSLVFVTLATCGSIALIFIHHIHMLLYLPTIAAIVVIRYYLTGRVTRADVIFGAVSIMLLAMAFIALQGYGNVRLSPLDFRQYIIGRMGSGAEASSVLDYTNIWFRTIGDEIRETWSTMAYRLPTIWAYPLLVAFHAPLLRYYRDSIRALASQRHQRIFVAALATISIGYLIIFLVVLDYARWACSWAVCMILMLHAVKQLPTDKPVAPIGADDDRRTLGLATLLACLPRVGIIKPF